MLFLTDSFRVAMLPEKETQVQVMRIHPENVRNIIARYNNFMCCFRKEEIARKFVDETGFDATVNPSYFNLADGDKVINVSINSEGDLVLQWINLLNFEEC